MKKSLIVITSVLFLAGCTPYGKLVATHIPNTCGGHGHSVTWIQYGDSNIGALAVTNIGRKSEWRFMLHPDNPGGGAYADALVTITAKPSGDPQPWLSISGRYSDGNTIVLCVPDTLVVGTTIDYMIDVADVGMLDPRAVVVPNVAAR